VQIFKALTKSKIQFKFQRNSFPGVWPSRPVGLCSPCSLVGPPGWHPYSSSLSPVKRSHLHVRHCTASTHHPPLRHGDAPTVDPTLNTPPLLGRPDEARDEIHVLPSPFSAHAGDLGWRVENCIRWIPAVWGYVQWTPKSLRLVIIPKSKDRFMERPPMKIVQPWAYIGTAWRSMW
jgi:hypothetical protein